MELTEIIQAEATNEHRIYLFHLNKGRVWGCYGRSALLLHRLYPNISYRDRDVSGKGDVVPVMIIDLLTLGDLVERFPPIERNEDSMIFELPTYGK